MKRILSTKYNELGWNIGLLILRLAFGYAMLLQGIIKLRGYGIAESKHNVEFMNQLFGSPFDGYLVIFAEFFCAIFLMLGLFTRYATLALVITMGVAFFKYHHSSIVDGETSFLYLAAFFCLILTGPGKYSIDRIFAK
jgi:putative oxidoreductase